MHRAALANEAGAELFEDPVRLHEHAPEALRVVRIVGGVAAVCTETHRAGDLAWQLIDAHLDAELHQRLQRFGIEVGDALRPQR